jgi:heat shock protein HslJ
MKEPVMKRYLFLSLVCTLLFSCKEQARAPFSGIKWVMERVSAQGIKTKSESLKIFIVFDDTTRVARGQAGCNTFLATYRKEGRHGLSFSGLEASKTTCPDIYMEAMFFKMLEETNNYTLRSDKLYLRKDDETIAVFRPGRVE